MVSTRPSRYVDSNISGQPARARWRTGSLVLVLALAGIPSVVWAGGQALTASAVAAAPAKELEASSVRLSVGRSTVVDVGATITRVSLTSAEVADAMVTSPTQLLINGKLPGTISMFVWDKGGALRRYEVVVQRDLARLSEQVRQLLPGEQIDVQSNGKNVVLSGKVTSKDVVDRAVSLASGYVDKKDDVVSLLQLQEGAPSNQVLLRVRFAEVSRSAMTELGLSLAANGYKNGRWFGRSTTEQFAAPQWDEQGRFIFSDFLNLFLFDSKNELAGVMRALQTKGLFQSLAEPNLVAESGKEASFLAGGEFPIPIVQGSNANFGITVVFKEFGIRLTFTPTVNGNRVHLKVKPEVSTLDFNNAIQLQGFRIPALSTRRTETELELQNQQTFAIAGLLDNNVRSSLQKIPGIGDIPILGYLFSSKAAQKERTELVVMITPEILPNNSNGVTPNLPRTPEPFLPPLSEKKSLAPPPPPFAGGQTRSSSAAPIAPTQKATASTTHTPAAAAAAVSALTPAAPQVVTSPSESPAPTLARPLTDQEKKALERARREDEQRAKQKAVADERAKADDAKKQAAQAAIDKRKADAEHARQQKAASEQAKRDAEAARRAEEVARKQLQQDREQRKGVDDAAARLKAAQDEYDAAQAKRAKQQ